jgi:dihydropyrimidinase
MNIGYNSFEGMELEGRPHAVSVRGKVAARDGEFVGELGRGKLIEREQSTFLNSFTPSTVDLAYRHCSPT